MPSSPVSGLDRADGLAGRPGTPLPTDQLPFFAKPGPIAVQQQGGQDATLNDIQIQELPDSPEIERAEQATITHRFRMSWTEALNRLGYLGRGTILTDSYGDVTKVLSSKVQFQPPGMGILTVVEEGLSFDTPPDTFNVVPVEMGLNILKHPRYFYALTGNNAAEALLNQPVIRQLQNYFDNPNIQNRDWITYLLTYSMTSSAYPNSAGSISYSGNTAAPVPGPDVTPPAVMVNGVSVAQTKITPVTGTDLAKAAAIEIIQKYWRGEETPYIVGWQMTWTAFYFRPPYLNPGGYVENPMTDAVPQLPDYFYSPTYPPSPGSTMFDLMGRINPQCYSLSGLPGAPNISWLRKADQQQEERTWFRVDRTWIGSPVGFWDPDFFAARNRPQVSTDYSHVSAPINPKKPANINDK